MKPIAIAAIAALLSLPAAAQEAPTHDQVCAELGDVVYAAVLGAADVRVNRGSFSDALATAQGLAGDQLDILATPDAYSNISHMVEGLVVDIYQTPPGVFSGGQHSDVPFQMAGAARDSAQSGCMQDFRAQGF